ncbi:hypothetical protein [Pseudomonas fluorescens]|uniref:Uncharacterized protein n=1 Tax=Pseudomonas fluorescens TaxID=294 RepID=A0A5E7RW79_PSEFL|nr:hypothetical protein [Pseudomonas fluorescens]VVP78782.1 hypothetical protein PS928_00514 [Pseudomonas fluorescens]
MPALPEVGQYTQDEKDELEQWADESGIGMDQLESRILQMANRVVERRSAARLAADKASLRNRLAAHCAQRAQAENVVSIFPAR